MVRQLSIVGPAGKTVRPDLLVFLNGMPIAVVEQKDPADAQADLWSAISQMQRYIDRAPALFVPNVLLAASDGRFYTLAADKLPGGRGFGEPVKLMVDIEGEGNIVALFPASRAGKLLLASSDGRGFVAPAAGAVAETRKGKQVVNLRAGAKLRVVRPVGGGHDYVAVIGGR